MNIQYLISIVVYMAAVILIGVYCSKRANKSTDDYFLGGRTLGPWVSAMSAEASDMSGWLLMGLPGLAYWNGLASAGWTAIGLALGTYLNWLIVSKRLRRYSERVGAITIPEYFSNRFHEQKPVLLVIASLLIIVFFSFVPNNMVTLVVMLALFSWSGVARIVRAQTLTLKERDFVIAAKTLGVSHPMIILKHIIPNMTTQIIVAASLSVASAILDESALSFLGYGVALPKSSC